MAELSNRKHEAIAREVGLFGTDLFQAYCAQGYAAHPGNAARLARDPAFDARVRELSAVAMNKAAELAGVDRARALAEQARIAYSNILDFLEVKEGKLQVMALDAIPRDKAAAIREIGYDSNGNIRIKLHDKVTALASLLKATEPADQRPPLNDATPQPEAKPPASTSRWAALARPTEPRTSH